MNQVAKRSANHPLHSMCSYLGTYPPHVPRCLLANWIPAGGFIVDPFCGAGTTLLEASFSGRPSLGIDMNPLAVAISTAKIQSVTIEDALHRLTEIANEFEPVSDLRSVPEQVGLIFHERTIRQLCYLREVLQESPEDVFLRGALLGILHGKRRRDGTSTYLSIDMPNTFSMSPEYVRKYVAQHHLTYKPVDVFSKLRERVRWLLRKGSVESLCESSVIYGDATQISRIVRSQNVNSIGGIITSPPYLGVLKYGAFNWIRLWFLGLDPAAVDARLDTTDSLDRYLSFMLTFLLSSGEVLTNGAPLILVIGDVVERDQRLELASRVWEELEASVPFDLECLLEDNFNVNDKTTRIWGERRKGKATPSDRVLVLRKRG
jgi:site-specific DNA-methyltransferase (adenine-specific)